jgi:hypothetical protein
MTITAKRSKQIRNAVAKIAIAFGLTVAAVAPAAACNPFEILFGGCRQTQAFYPPQPMEIERAPAQRNEAKRKVVGPHVASNGVSGKQQPLAARPGAPVGSLALFADDPTLRAGDIVVTNNGFMVYERHAFQPISQKNGQLAEMQKVSMEAIRAAARQAAPASDKVATTTTSHSAQIVTPQNSWVGLRREASGVRREASLQEGRTTSAN